MNKPNKSLLYSRNRKLSSYVDFKDLLLEKESLYNQALEDFNGVLPVSIDDSSYFMTVEDEYGNNIIVLYLELNYDNINFKAEMKEYKGWRKDQENIARLQEQVKKDYEAKKKVKNG